MMFEYIQTQKWVDRGTLVAPMYKLAAIIKYPTKSKISYGKIQNI